MSAKKKEPKHVDLWAYEVTRYLVDPILGEVGKYWSYLRPSDVLPPKPPSRRSNWYARTDPQDNPATRGLGLQAMFVLFNTEAEARAWLKERWREAVRAYEADQRGRPK